MRKELILPHVSYDIAADPFPPEQFDPNVSEGNCRRAVQLYFYATHHRFIPPEDILPPVALRERHTIIKTTDIPPQERNRESFFSGLQRGDIIYAAKFRTKKGTLFDYRTLPMDELIASSHTAIFLGELTAEENERLAPQTLGSKLSYLWHSSFISGGTAVWSVDKFCYYYLPLVAKRIPIPEDAYPFFRNASL